MQKFLIYLVLRNKALPTQLKLKSGGSYYIIILLSLFFSISKYEKIVIWEKNKVIYNLKCQKQIL